MEYLEELAKDYQAILGDQQQFEYEQPQEQQQGPYMGSYNDQTTYYGYNQGRDYEGEGSVGENLEIMGDVAEEYLRLADRVEEEEKNNLQRLYQIYLDKYKDVLQGKGDNHDAGDDQGAYDYQEEDEEYTNNINAEDEWRILQKLQQVKEDMQAVYDEHQEELEDNTGNTNMEQVAFESSVLESVSSEGGGESSVQDEGSIPGDGSIWGDSWGPLVTETVTPSRIEELVPSETGESIYRVSQKEFYNGKLKKYIQVWHILM